MNGCGIDQAVGFDPVRDGTPGRDSYSSAAPFLGTRRQKTAGMSRLSKPPEGFSRFGFTLVELLMVIAVIAILASLLLPALSRAKQSADNAVCQNNLRQQSIGLAMYVGDFGAYPRYLS